jgi:5-methylcytosine-specific restriction endonuclease McrA
MSVCDESIDLIRAHVSVSYDWATYCFGSDSEARGGLTLSVVATFGVLNKSLLRLESVTKSFDTVTVIPSTEDKLVFERFKAALRKAEERCRPPQSLKTPARTGFRGALQRWLEPQEVNSTIRTWAEGIDFPEFRSAESDVVNTGSFQTQVTDTPMFTTCLDDNDCETFKYVLFRHFVWKCSLRISNEGCEAFLREFFRRELLGEMDRLDHSDFFAELQSQTAQRERIPESVKHQVWRRDQGKCVMCGSNERLEFDHIIPVSKGGSCTSRNLQLLCEPCNRQKTAFI